VDLLKSFFKMVVGYKLRVNAEVNQLHFLAFSGKNKAFFEVVYFFYIL